MTDSPRHRGRLSRNLKLRTEEADRRPRHARTPVQAHGLRALLPPLLALRHAPHLLRQALLVHRHLPDPRPHDGRERDGHLAPAPHQARPLRRLALQQRRLGPLARALLGHPPARVALRGRPHTHDRLLLGIGAALGLALEDHHRPYVDEVKLACPHQHDLGSIPSTRGGSEGQPSSLEGLACGLPMTRVPEVIDVWFDSGSMPFAQHHYPYQHEQQFQKEFPADFICEALDQTEAGSTHCWRSRPCYLTSPPMRTSSASA